MDSEKGVSKDFKYLSRIMRDITDGLIVLDTEGTVVFVNPSALKILDNPALVEGKKYIEFMVTDRTGENDDFHQYVLDCAGDKNKEHEGLLNYSCPNGEKRVFRMISSYAYNEEMTENIGVILQFSDVTEVAKAHQKHVETTVVLVALLAMLSIWNLIFGIWEFRGRAMPGYRMTQLIEVMGAIVSFLVYKKTSITKEDLGISFKGTGRAVLTNGLFTALILLGMIAVKLVLRNTSPNASSLPMFYFGSWGIADTVYPITVIVQEFLTRGVVQGSVKRILPGKHAVLISIILSSLFFCALHIHLGLGFMIGSFLLLSVFGVIYERQKTIWGLCIPHYFLGLSLKLIWGIGA